MRGGYVDLTIWSAGAREVTVEGRDWLLDLRAQGRSAMVGAEGLFFFLVLGCYSHVPSTCWPMVGSIDEFRVALIG